MKSHQSLVWHWKQVPVFFHWSLLLWFPWFYLQSQRLVPALLSSLAMVLVMLAHESGHALMAWLRRTRVHALHVHLLQGRCEHAHPYREIDDVLIAWGGVLAQAALLVVAVLLQLALVQLAPQAALFMAPAFATLVFSNLLWMAFNLLPLAPLDGHLAWRIIPLLRGPHRPDLRDAWRDLRQRLAAAFSTGKGKKKNSPPQNGQASADTVTYELLKRLREQRHHKPPAPPAREDDRDEH